METDRPTGVTGNTADARGDDQDDQAHHHKQEHVAQQAGRLEGQPGQTGTAPGEE